MDKTIYTFHLPHWPSAAHGGLFSAHSIHYHRNTTPSLYFSSIAFDVLFFNRVLPLLGWIKPRTSDVLSKCCCGQRESRIFTRRSNFEFYPACKFQHFVLRLIISNCCHLHKLRWDPDIQFAGCQPPSKKFSRRRPSVVILNVIFFAEILHENQADNQHPLNTPSIFRCCLACWRQYFDCRRLYYLFHGRSYASRIHDRFSAENRNGIGKWPGTKGGISDIKRPAVKHLHQIGLCRI